MKGCHGTSGKGVNERHLVGATGNKLIYALQHLR
jgi:hypothetical protein